MNAQDYIAAGYNISSLIAQAQITRAEQDVLRAYIVPVYPNAAQDVETNPVIRRAVMTFTELLLAERSIFVTRAGSKTKQTEKSYTPTRSELLQQYANDCHAALQDVRALEGSISGANVNDICGVYFKSNYFNS